MSRSAQKARELGEDEDQEAVELSDSIGEVLAESLVEPHQLPEVVEAAIRRRRRLWALLCSEASDAERVRPVRFRSA